MNWLSRKIHLYNVTMGLYMLDWWERWLFNTLLVVLLWFVFYNGSKAATDLYNRYSTDHLWSQLKGIISRSCFYLSLSVILSAILAESFKSVGMVASLELVKRPVF